MKLQSIQGDVVERSNKVLHCVKLHLGLFLKQPCYTVALLCIILVPSVNFTQFFMLHCCIALHCIPPGFIFLVALLHCYTCSSRAFISYVLLHCCVVLYCVALHLFLKGISLLSSCWDIHLLLKGISLISSLGHF